jgi:ornithine cyclodeaminase/alanine dehydrogenase-like protein (mu-crystallin family)
MPAHLRAPDAAAGADLVGMKWVTVFRENKARGLPATNAVVVLNDPATGLPTAILDGGPITAQRTAAVSGVAMRLFAPRVDGRSTRAAIVGAGVQGLSHLEVVAFLLPGVELVIFDRHPERAEALAARAVASGGIATAVTAPSARAAADGADVVITAASMAPPDERQAMAADWLAPGALLVSVDYATFCSAQVARDADLFVTDERGQFLANRDAGLFEGFPDPSMTIGEAVLARAARPPGRVVVNHLGVGLADLVFAEALVAGARASGRGTILPR